MVPVFRGLISGCSLYFNKNNKQLNNCFINETRKNENMVPFWRLFLDFAN
jgi:hypothetical protein